MGKIGTLQEAIKAAIEADTVELPEFPEDSVVLANLPEVKDLNQSIHRAVRKSEGLALVLYDRSGSNPDPEGSLVMNLEMKVELYVSPKLRDVELKPILRPVDSILESVMRFLHGRLLESVTGHCMDEIRVLRFQEIGDPDYVVFEIIIGRRMKI